MKLLSTTTKNNKPSNIYQLENIEELGNIYGDNNDTYHYKNYQFTVVRQNNDINGNPIYKITLAENFECIINRLQGMVYRCYKSKNYALIQSYNLSNSLEHIFYKISK